jgi:REP-associated tyrosine transposase
MFTRRPERLANFDYLGFHRYSLCFCTFNRHHAFVTQEPVDLVLAQFLRSTDEERFALVAYCFMPDHVHLLVEGKSEGSDCKRFISRAKQYSGFYYRKEFGRPLWQRYGFEHVLRGEDVTLVVARYIVNNPVRAGLVDDCRDYPYTGSSVYALDEILDAIQDRIRWSG